jgi:hypothetical protein
MSRQIDRKMRNFQRFFESLSPHHARHLIAHQSELNPGTASTVRESRREIPKSYAQTFSFRVSSRCESSLSAFHCLFVFRWVGIGIQLPALRHLSSLSAGGGSGIVEGGLGTASRGIASKLSLHCPIQRRNPAGGGFRLPRLEAHNNLDAGERERTAFARDKQRFAFDKQRRSAEATV